MPLHPTVAKFIAELPAPPPGPLNPEAMRAVDESNVPSLEKRLPVHSVIDRAVSTAIGDVPVRVYTPSAAKTHPALVYFHGGAGFLGSLNTHDHVARELANSTDCVVISVGYRLAPEHAFPAGLSDCYAVVQWVAEHGQEESDGIGWDGQTLAVAGDSSGAGFAAAIAAKALDEGLTSITHQVLYYPGLDLDFDTERYESLKTNAVGNGLETAMLKPFNAFYLDSGADPADPLVSPIKRQDLAGLPPALIVTAECDPLRDEGEVYGQKLAEAGVSVTVRRYESAGHGFVQHFSWLPEFHGVFAETAAFLRGQG
ncbi:alpha/beta hydrolase [Marinobacterium mangrovicola]|uniref:Acetyl esterase n=1 Tax=Marinobacterium mangrovicola TaxID=1476959 RepID=A0A4V2PCX8_9GAMM|nr:alpha/beta hydrolase [Marinobacterium mangrovicola]TCK02946.1 acetyl esterase [Marinobacterium mangrovicola]